MTTPLTLESLAARIAALEAVNARMVAAVTGKVAGGAIADDADLDGRFGNEDIKRDPSAKYWEGDSYVGSRMSDCSAEYLDVVAKWKEACAYMNDKEGSPEKAKYAGYDRKTAARARGWAVRVRAGKTTPKVPVSAPVDNYEPEDAPF